MKNIIAVKYIDAIYFKKGEKFKFSDFKINVAVGWMKSFKEHILVFFSKKDNQPEEGILIPKAVILFDKNNKKENLFLNKIKIGSSVGIYWKDIVYFNESEAPKKPATMYSEGNIFYLDDTAVALEKQETVKIDGAIKNHPKEIASYIVIPKSMIINLEVYE